MCVCVYRCMCIYISTFIYTDTEIYYKELAYAIVEAGYAFTKSVGRQAGSGRAAHEQADPPPPRHGWRRCHKPTGRAVLTKGQPLLTQLLLGTYSEESSEESSLWRAYVTRSGPLRTLPIV